MNISTKTMDFGNLRIIRALSSYSVAPSSVDRVKTGAYQHRLPRGPIGTSRRAGFNGQVVTVFGGTGFIGRSVISRLCGMGCQVILPHRLDPNMLRDFRLMGELGQINFYPLNVDDPGSIARSIKYSNVVVNLLGRQWETRNFSFNDVHVRIAKEIAKCCREMNIERFIHVSSLNASPSPPSFYFRPSQFLISKYKGENEVLSEFPGAFIVRPSNVYGHYDAFLWYYYRIFRSRNNGSIAAYARGKKTMKAPVSVHDVTTAICKLCCERVPTSSGQYDLFGPEMYTLYDLLTYYLRCTFQPKAKVIYMKPSTLLRVYMGSFYVTNKICNLDNLEREFVNDCPTSDLQFATLGIEPKPITYYWPIMCQIFSRFVNRNLDFEMLPSDDCLHPIEHTNVPAASIPNPDRIGLTLDGFI